ncbi:MFS transporter [Arthrobacter sp. SDTb3-6]|uniref:MFS transporter n=1 Tax=Arthrobacter sp. SDTb3-6 TaxID=2713571 RepID=UPI0035249912
MIFGSLGDKFGRKRTLMWTLNLMGVATFLVGLIPGYASIGFAAPAILVGLRLLQGLSAGGEQAGSNSLSLEHAPAGKRGLYTSWTMQGTSLGTLLASMAFIVIAGMPQDAMLAWGWRIPFLVAGPLMLVPCSFAMACMRQMPSLKPRRPTRTPKSLWLPSFAATGLPCFG